MASKVDDTSDSSAVTEALRNSVILHEIFKNFETKFLLTSCRLVNQVWSSEAASFIQNYRQCKVVQPNGSGPCKFLRDFDNWIGQLTTSGRKIPYNGLKIEGVWDRHRCSVISVAPSPDLPWPNLKNHFNFKYFEGLCHDADDGFQRDRDCPTHYPFANLIRLCGEKLLILEINNPRQLESLWDVNEQPSLPQLKVFNISQMLRSEEFQEEEKDAVRKLLNAAMKLEKIVAAEVDQLRLIPVEKLVSLEVEWPLELNFRMEKNEDIDLLHSISGNGSSDVKHLSIYVPPFHGQFEFELEHGHIFEGVHGFIAPIVNFFPDFHHDELGDPEDEIVGLDLRRSFDQACQQMLHSCHSNLKTISIYGVLPLADLHFPPLPNVSKLEVTKRYVSELGPFWNSVASTDYERIMPGLQEVKICIETGFFGLDAICTDRDLDWEAEWPPAGNAANNYYSSSTVEKLTLELQIRKVNLEPIQTVFPNVTILHFHLPWTGGAGLMNVPLGQVWKYFPQLVELEITGDCRYMGPILDADFCGITEEEVALLGQQTDEYLKLVHIVPIRPSILTMPNLRDLYIEYDEFGAHDVDELDRNDRFPFISKVTRLVAFDRMLPEVELYIPSYMESGRESDEGDDDEDMMDYDEHEMDIEENN